MQLSPVAEPHTPTRLQMVAKLAAIAILGMTWQVLDATAQSPIAAQPPSAAAALSSQTIQERNAAVILVKNAILAVNQGNLTGNYTVLRDLSSPGFRERNSAADLAAIFQDIRRQKIDLSPTVVLEPTLCRPQLKADGQLILEGYFSSEPLRINFQLSFLKANSNGWMIHAVSLNATPQAAPVTGRVVPASGVYR